MIRASLCPSGYVFSGDLRPGSVAFLDVDWIFNDLPSEVPALIAEPEGLLRWCDQPAVPLPGDLDSQTAAGLVFIEVARAAAAAAEEGRAGPVEISGGGIVARLVCAFLSHRERATGVNGAAPSVFVDTTGDPSQLESATRRLVDLGSLVLAGETAGRILSLQLYPDIHVRGLRILAVAPPLQNGIPGSSDDADEKLRTILRGTLRLTSAEVATAPGAAWYGISF